MGWSPDKLQPWLRAAPPTHPPLLPFCGQFGAHWSQLHPKGGSGGVNMFNKNFARIRGKLAGNWRHLQKQKRGGADRKRWGSGLAFTHLLVGGRRFFPFFGCAEKMTFVLCHADRIQMPPRDVNRGSHLEQWSPSALSPLRLSRLAPLKQHVLSAEPKSTHSRVCIRAHALRTRGY